MLDLQEKDFGIVITKDIKDIYKKTLNAKENEKDTRTWNDIPWHGIEESVL